VLNKLYIVYGIAVIAGLIVAEYQGLSLATVNEVRNVPQSVRDNPGSYRSVYGGYHHYTGGK
jgi:hypothetical protein